MMNAEWRMENEEITGDAEDPMSRGLSARADLRVGRTPHHERPRGLKAHGSEERGIDDESRTTSNGGERSDPQVSTRRLHPNWRRDKWRPMMPKANAALHSMVRWVRDHV